MKLFEDDHVYAFLDIGPIAPKHALVIPKYHGRTVKDIPDEHLAKIVPALKKIAVASGEENFNLLANAGTIAHQVSREQSESDRGNRSTERRVKVALPAFETVLPCSSH